MVPPVALMIWAARRLDHRVAVVADHDRQARRVQALLFEQLAAGLGVGAVKLERHAEAGKQLPQLVGAAVVERSDDAEQLEAGFLVLGPVGQEPADRAVKILFEHPRLGEVVIGLAQRHGLDDRAARRVVALDQEHPLGQRVQVMRTGQEVDSGHLAHLVIGDEQCHRLAPAGHLAQPRQPGGGRRLTDDPEVLAEPPAEIVAERVHHPGLVIDHEQDGSCHRVPAQPGPDSGIGRCCPHPERLPMPGPVRRHREPRTGAVRQAFASHPVVSAGHQARMQARWRACGDHVKAPRQHGRRSARQAAGRSSVPSCLVRVAPRRSASLCAGELGGHGVGAQPDHPGQRRVGTLTSIGRELYPGIIEHFAKRQPGWHVELRSFGWGDPTAGLSDQATDAAFLWLPVDAADVEFEILVTERRFVAISSRHPLAGREAVEFAEIASEPFAALPASAGPAREFWLATGRRAGLPGSPPRSPRPTRSSRSCPPARR